MKFLVDAHLPPSLCRLLSRHGHDAIHTEGLPTKNESKDGVLNAISVSEERVVISKDTDFYFSHLLHQRPWKLLLVRTGNIGRRELCDLIERNLPAVVAAVQSHTLVEIDREAVTPVA